MSSVTRRSFALFPTPFRLQTSNCSGFSRKLSVFHTQRSYIRPSYECSKSAHALNGSTIGAMLQQQVERQPDRDMLVCREDNVRLTYQAFKEKMDDLAAGLIALGVKPGDRVGIWSPNRSEWVLTQFATAAIGAILVTINPAYRVHELEYALNKVGVTTLIMAESFKTQDYYNMVFELCPELSTCSPGKLKSQRLPTLQTVVVMGDTKKQGSFSFDDVCRLSTKELRLEIENVEKKLNFDQPINIQFTSGTTGNPKAATLTHHNILNNASFVGHRMGYDQEHATICIPVPLYHCFGMVCGVMTTPVFGSTCVLPSKAFNPVASLEAVQAERCNTLYGTPTMFIDMLHVPNFDTYDKSSLEKGIMAGAPCPVEVMKDVISKLNIPKACVAYGSTETSPVSFLSFPDTPLEKRCDSIGYVLDHTEAKIVDESGHVVPRGENGELCTRGYSTMLGYWEDKAKTDAAISPTRWYHSGDIGSMDEDGYVKLNGRMKDMIIRGGENIYPVEIEQFLHTHPSVEDVQVVGLPDKRMGEEICASIKLKDGMTLTEQEVKDFCKGEISHFKIPRYVVFADQFPLTVTGKVLKYQMRAELIQQFSLENENA
ncbi:medium-chain acyl-CoA ligase ACSF2, mitochondrial-like [Watersipora subatra]|uniref:medium-chain acyl-CoA ligase ACSF2, mitochondrial-like n=1 Tax=Watersipora subatra TaxID=2589382 RepID=UPI00355B575F